MKLPDYIASDGALSQSALCRLIGAHPPDMSRWVSGDRPIPADKCALIELHTGGASTCEENMPDLVWLRVPDPNWPHKDGRPALDVSRHAEPVIPPAD
jgi:DNA-binding transcriptional regulator YdaS (Cro superfamily)